MGFPLTSRNSCKSTKSAARNPSVSSSLEFTGYEVSSCAEPPHQIHREDTVLTSSTHIDTMVVAPPLYHIS